MLLPRWDLWLDLVARSNCTNQFQSKKSVHASKPGRQIWIPRLANPKNDDCSRMRCGLGQTALDDGAVEQNGRSCRGETWIDSHTGRSSNRYNHRTDMHYKWEMCRFNRDRLIILRKYVIGPTFYSIIGIVLPYGLSNRPQSEIVMIIMAVVFFCCVYTYCNVNINEIYYLFIIIYLYIFHIYII